MISDLPVGRQVYDLNTLGTFLKNAYFYENRNLMLQEEYRSLSIAERILLVEDIWDSISDDAAIKLSPAQKALLDEREQDALSGKISGKSWAEIKNAITSGGK